MFSFDPGVTLAINTLVGRSHFADSFMMWLADANFIKGIPMVMGLWFCWFRAPHAANRRFVVTTLLGVMIAIALSRGFELLGPFNPRPIHDPGLHMITPNGFDHVDMKYMSSFPSDHAAMFGAFATAWFYWSRRAGWLALGWALIVVCFPRLYLGYHYLSDIIAGLALGFSVIWTVFRLPISAKAADLAARMESNSPALFYPLAFLLTSQVAVIFIDLRVAIRVLGKLLIQALS